MNIQIESKEGLRYNSCGDYFIKKGVVHINVMDQSNEDHNFLLCIHELIEWYITHKRGIKEPDIMKFDIMFEKERDKGFHSEFAEPGDDIRSPYRKEHRFAENIERQIAHELGVDWDDYNNNLISYETKDKKVKGRHPSHIDSKIGK